MHTHRGRIRYQRPSSRTSDSLWKKVCKLSCVDPSPKQYSMIGVIILCLPQTRISPGRTTGISFLCAHTLAHTYGLFTCLVPLGLSSPLHGGLLLRLMRKTSKHAPSVLEHASTVTQTWGYFGYEMTRKHSKKKKKMTGGSEFSRIECFCIRFAVSVSMQQFFKINCSWNF